MDKISAQRRSWNMSRIRSQGNSSTEVRLIAEFRSRGIKGWRRHQAVPGKPDFVWRRPKIAVFVDGCFWHGHHCLNRRPKSNTDYWSKKISRNIQRDAEVTNLIEANGYLVLRIWECELKSPELLEAKLSQLETWLRDQGSG